MIGRIQGKHITEEVAALLLLRDRIYQTINEVTRKFDARDLLHLNYYKPNRAHRRLAARSKKPRRS